MSSSPAPAKMRRVDPPILATPRLRLRPLEGSDADALHAIQSDPEHMRFYPHPFSMDETRAWIERMRDRYEEVGFGLLAVEDRASGEFLGNVGPVGQRVDGIDEIELGWSITRRRAREGIATEAATACRGWVFGVLGADHVDLVDPAREHAVERGRPQARHDGLEAGRVGRPRPDPRRLARRPRTRRRQSVTSIRSITMSSTGRSCGPVATFAIRSITS